MVPPRSNDGTHRAPPPRTGLTGAEPVAGTSATVADFWRFAMSDLRMNNTRGYLAEFLVAQALGLRDVRRIEWDAYDLLVDERIRVEVKSSAYLQAWEQRQLSTIRFTGLRGQMPGAAVDAPVAPTLNADVYVFCVQTATDHGLYDPLDLAQWQFYVLGRSDLEAAGVKDSLGLATLTRLAGGPTPRAALDAEVHGRAGATR